MVEIFGVLASVIVSISFFMNGEKRIRIINTFGSTMFLIYGVLLGSVSLILLNTISIIVNILKIYKLKEEISNENNDHPHR